MTAAARKAEPQGLDPIDRRIVVETQGGLPLCPRPYHAVAERLGLAPDDVMRRMLRMLAEGAIRRIAAVPNHYALGYRANGMSVWDVEDARVSEVGRRIAAFDFVSHCYRRPRHARLWPYNLFAMVHGRTREEVKAHVAVIGAAVDDAARAHDVLFSTRILKKTGLRIAG